MTQCDSAVMAEAKGLDRELLWAAPFANSWNALEALVAPNVTVPLSDKSMRCMGSVGFMAVFDTFEACETWIKHFEMGGEPIPLERRKPPCTP